ncbi:methane monooxygenase/ammonia monooxygenase subunit B [Nocardioides sp. CF8]|uniref:methane monooxygenase/ammonia monooxygenase subunit B n=1 Tax=Nocardioides sp. CF8 TaxID=110319 RepID=UPI0004139E44|nr:methane monooxygenase/ammonia monooxygenase subunit B [Nocardioides sp. CF8]
MNPESTGHLLRRLFRLAVGVLALLVLPVSPASAHGEESQQAFQRTSTVVFYDVKFSDDTVDVGESVTITGMVRVMKSWPDHTLEPPEMGYLTVSTPGPVFYVQEREMSGEFTPQSVRIEKGATYPFKLVIKARQPGTWHVHPGFGVEGAGTLVGAGKDITVNDTGVFENTVTLANGTTVDLETFGLGRVVTWHLISLVVGLAWLLFWLRRPILDRAMAISEGRGATLITRSDRRIGIGFAVVALVVGTGGYAYAEMTQSSSVPLQVVRTTPVPLAEEEVSGAVAPEIESIRFNAEADTLTMKLRVENTGAAAVRLQRVQFGDVEFVSPSFASAADPDAQAMTVTPDQAIEPGGSATFTVEIQSEDLIVRSLVPVNEAELRVTGLLFFEDETGEQVVSEVNELTSAILQDFH